VADIKFGTDGWRAIMCEDFTFGNVRKVVQAIVEYIKAHGNEKKGIIIGYDARFLSERFAEVAAEVMMGNGIKVFCPKRDIPTPVTAFAVAVKSTAGAIMFTASHNPPEYNGIKYIPDYAGPADPEITKEIESYLNQPSVSSVPNAQHAQPAQPTISIQEGLKRGLFEYYDPNPEYISRIKNIVDIEAIRKSGLRIAVDPMYAAGHGYFEEIFNGVVSELITLRDKRDPLFGGSSPDPVEDNLQELIDIVKSGKADIGLALDGDADRFGIIDKNGRYISPNQVISILLVHLIKNRKYSGGVARTVATSHLIDRIADKYGIEMFETPVGFKYIGKLLRNHKLVIGGEESGGLSISTHIPEKDGILAGCLMAECMAMEGKSFTELLDEIMSEVGYHYTRRIDLRYPDDKKSELIHRLRHNPPEFLNGQRVVKVLDMDGAKLVLEDGSWFLLRPSGTEPLIRIYAEAHDPSSLNKILKDVQGLL
jgi:alpha-D-glucose phosphate-specific phosphoglucomutase